MNRTPRPVAGAPVRMSLQLQHHFSALIWATCYSMPFRVQVYDNSLVAL